MNFIELKFMAKTENVLIARSLATVFLINKNPPMSIINEVKTIVSEAVTNAIIHGYESKEDKEVTLKLTTMDGYIQIEVIDYGKGIEDIEKAKRPMYTTKKDEERSGLGFTIMDVFSDSMEIFSKINEGTTVRCLKKLEIEEEEKISA